MTFKSIAMTAAAVLLASTSTLSFASGTHDGGHAGDSAIGLAGEAANVTRTITVDMTDNMRFSPASIAARQGETIKFIVKNSGKVKHEMVFGTPAELKEHYAQMLKFPEMEHEDANQVTVQPGKSGEIIWQFSKAGNVDFACLQPGHFDAGMKGMVAVGAKAMAKDGHGEHKH